MPKLIYLIIYSMCQNDIDPKFDKDYCVTYMMSCYETLYDKQSQEINKYSQTYIMNTCKDYFEL
jgi:hypothetical protein